MVVNLMKDNETTTKNNVTPLHKLNNQWKNAYTAIYGEQPSKDWADISASDKKQITSILNKWQKEQEAKAKEEERNQQNRAYFESDTPDSFISEWIRSTSKLDNFAIDSEMETIFKYNGKHWELLEYKAFERFISEDCLAPTMPDGYANGKVRAVADMTHKVLSYVPEPKHGYINFNNCAVEITKDGTVKTFVHNKNLGLTATSLYNYDQSLTDCPNFLKWLNHSATNKDGDLDDEKRNTLLAMLYFVATNQYRWQFFIEVVGVGGSGKSVALFICKILAGGDGNTVNLDLDSLEGQKGKGALQNIIGKRLIMSPDQETTAGEMAMLKRVTGNDPISIPRMHKCDVNLPFWSGVIVITANQPLVATDRSSGVFRRRVSIFMDNVVKEDDKDINLTEKLEQEASAIFNYVLSSFNAPQDAYKVLKDATKGKDKIAAMLATEPLTQWINDCLIPSPAHRELIGSKMGIEQARKGGQTNTAKPLLEEAERALYPNYLVWCEANGINKPLSVVKFPDAVEAKILQLETLGFIPLNKVKPKNKSTFENIQINQHSELLADLRKTVEDYCVFKQDNSKN